MIYPSSTPGSGKSTIAALKGRQRRADERRCRPPRAFPEAESLG